jgi:hypothetical protein
MYRLNDQQIDYILNDIRARGVEMESLQNDLLDHVCCIVENKLEESGDFERFYESIIKTFYKKELKEIEEETITLLNNKHYYAMKKIMIGSGIISAILLSIGIILKFLHMPGAAVGIVTGVTSFSLIFLPLMFLLKLKEKESSRDKILLGLGSLVTVLISMAILFKIMHWPYANMMGLLSVGILILLYLPINLVTGIRNPSTKVNTIVSSVLLVAGCGLFLSLARSPQGSKVEYIKTTDYFMRNNRLVENEMLLLEKSSEQPLSNSTSAQSKKILQLCEELKSYLLEKETGLTKLDDDFINKQAWISETYASSYLEPGSEEYKKLSMLVDMIKQYNESAKSKSPSAEAVPVFSILSDHKNDRVIDVLNNLVQVELFVLQSEMSLTNS